MTTLRKAALNIMTINVIDFIAMFGIMTQRNVGLMEQHALKIVNNSLNTNIYSYLEIGGQSSNLYLNVFHFFNASVNQTPVAA
jgi:hypothetical protein